MRAGIESAPEPTTPPTFASAADTKLWLSEHFARETDPLRLLAVALETMGRFLGVSRVAYGELDDALEWMTVPLDWTDGADSKRGRRAFARESAFARHYRAGRTMVIVDADTHPLTPEQVASLAKTGIRSVVGVPLIEGGKLVAVFNATHTEPRAWTEDEVVLFAQTGARIWGALQHLRMLEQLREGEEQFRTLAENMPGLCWLAHADGQAYWGNRRWTEFFAGTGAETGDASWSLHADDRERATGAWAAARESGAAIEMTLRMRGRDGIYRPFLSNASPIRDAAGDVVRWCGVLVDLSAQYAHDSRQTLLRAFSDATRDLTDASAILATMGDMTIAHMGVAQITYSEVTDDPTRFNVFLARPDRRFDEVPAMFRFAEGCEALLAGYRRGRTLVASRYDDDLPELTPAVIEARRAVGMCAAITVPLVKEGRLVAMLSASDPTPRRWSADEVQLVEELAERVWGSVSRARAEAALAERERNQSFLVAWNDRLRGELSPQAIMAATLEGLAQHLGVTRATYSESDATGRLFSILGEWRDDVVSIAGTGFSLDEVGEQVEREWSAGAIVRYDDVTTDPRIEPQVVDSYVVAEIVAFVSIPLIENGRVRSALSVQHRSPRRWTDSEVQLLRDVAERTWVLLERARAQAELLERERHQAFLIDWIDRVRGEGSAQAIMAATLEALGEHFGVTRATYAESDAEWRRFTVLGEWCDGVVSVAGASISVEDIGEQVERAWLAGGIIRYDDVTTDPRVGETTRARYRGIEIGAMITVPLLENGKVRSGLSVQHREARAWRDSEVQLLRDVAERTWVMLERARAQAELLERERHQAFLIGWSDAIRRQAEAQAIVATTLEWLGRHLGVTRATYADCDASGRRFTIGGEWRDGVASILGNSFLLESVGDAVDRAWSAGDIVRYDDVARDPRLEEAARARYRATEIAAFVSIPLIQGGRMRASLSLQHASPRAWREREIDLLRDIAERTWVALERAEAQAALRARERNQAFLLAWSDRVARKTDAEAILAETLAALGEHLGVQRANFAETSDDGLSLCVRQEWVEGVASLVDQVYPLAVLGDRLAAAHNSGQPVRVDDVATDPRFDAQNRPLFDGLGIAAVMTLPMLRLGDVVAALSVQQGTPRRWTDAEVELVAEVASRTLAVLERARSEERLAASEAQLSAFLENAPVAMHLKDANGRYVRVNPEFARALGRNRDDFQGAHPDELFPPDVAREVERLERIAKAGQVARAEISLESLAEGTHVLAMAFPVSGGAGGARTGGFTLDLTERKKAEAALARSRETLYQTEKLSALGSLLAGVSHELNNPLSIVVAQAVMMERQSRGGELAERAQKIRKAADRCARIVQTFLAMARQKQPERTATDLNALATAAHELTDFGLRTDGVATVRDFAAGLPTISADADQLHQIIVNLIVNAQQAMVEAGVADRVLTLRTAPGATPGTVILDVGDTGPGIPEQARRRIFEPFYTTKPQGQGTGVGLSFSQGLAEAHGGRLELVPSARGACFRLTLPIEAAARVAVDAPAAAVAGAGPARRALVVDDEREIAESLADFLSIEGFACDIADGGAAAQARLAQGDYDLIVSDLRMPQVDGPALYAWIVRERPALAARTGFATGDTLGAAAARFLAEAKRPVLEKPFMPDAVRRFLEQMDLP